MSVARKFAAQLENGAVMTREEFHAAYTACPGLRRAELIEGVVFMPSPVRYESHDRQASLIRGWLFSYTLKHPEVQSGNEATLVLGTSELQPDGFLMRTGSVPLDEEGYLLGAPQLVVEVAGSTASRDMHFKRDVCLRSGVDEYLVWPTLDEAIDWFRRTDDSFTRVDPDRRGIIESTSFPGLRLNVRLALAIDAVGLIGELR